MQKFLRQLVPFLLAGIAVVAFAFGILLLAYLLLFGAIVGVILFIIVWAKNKFFPPKSPAKRRPSSRIIDADHWKKM
jgi:hypothetical protein